MKITNLDKEIKNEDVLLEAFLRQNSLYRNCPTGTSIYQKSFYGWFFPGCDYGRVMSVDSKKCVCIFSKPKTALLIVNYMISIGKLDKDCEITFFDND